MNELFVKTSTFPPIRQLLPHEGKMVLLDRVLSADVENLCAEVIIHVDSLFCNEQGVGAWVGIEYMAQAIAAHAGYMSQLRGGEVKVGFLLGTRRFECQIPLFKLGTVLHVHAHCVLQSENGLGAFDCRIENGITGELFANATVTVFQPDSVSNFLQGNE